MKKFLALAFVLVLASAAAAQTNWFKGTVDEAVAKAKVEHKLVLVDFYSYTWGGCKLLGEQFYDNPKFKAFIEKNFIPFRAILQEPAGDAVFKKFGIRATPTTMVFDGDGAEVDWTVGYDAPPENFEAALSKIISGTETFKSYSDAYAKNPKDVPTVFKLARKWSDRYDEAKAAEKYKEVIRLDPQGKAGTYTQEYYKVTVPYTEFAEFSLATAAIQMSQKPDLAPVRAFLTKYPKSKLVKQAYSRMANYYGYSAPKEEAAKFFPEYAAKFPNDPSVHYNWLSRIVRDKEPLDKGAEIAAKLEEMTDFNPSLSINNILAQFYILKGDKAKAEEIYGKTFMENQISSFGYGLIGYSNFWINQNANLDNAVTMAETALKLQPDNSYFLSQAATAYIKAGKEEKALTVYGPAFARKNAGDASILYSYAGFWARQGKNLNDALAAAKKATTLMPTAYYIWNTLSLVQEKLKNIPEAVKAKEKAIELAPESLKANYQKDLERIKAIK